LAVVRTRITVACATCLWGLLVALVPARLMHFADSERCRCGGRDGRKRRILSRFLQGADSFTDDLRLDRALVYGFDGSYDAAVPDVMPHACGLLVWAVTLGVLVRFVELIGLSLLLPGHLPRRDGVRNLRLVVGLAEAEGAENDGNTGQKLAHDDRFLLLYEGKG